MITIIDSGDYKLTDTKHGIKLLRLRRSTFAWITAPHIGELLVYTTLPHVQQAVLSEGSYRLYNITDEPALSDQLHLELEVGRHKWQGYVLPVGFPTHLSTRRRIIPTHEVITSNKKFYEADAKADAYLSVC
jgi:hypothetical protein